jgi:hypothetical protein
MEHRRLFIGSMVLIPVGIALLIVGNVIAPLGMFGQTSSLKSLIQIINR